jgi:hypothetical protein
MSPVMTKGTDPTALTIIQLRETRRKPSLVVKEKLPELRVLRNTKPKKVRELTAVNEKDITEFHSRYIAPTIIGAAINSETIITIKERTCRRARQLIIQAPE